MIKKKTFSQKIGEKIGSFFAQTTAFKKKRLPGVGSEPGSS
jgi:hypothetical protein